MKKPAFYLFLILLCNQLFAQENAASDSVYFYRQLQREVDWSHTSTTHLLLRNFKNVAQSQLYAAAKGGSFRRASEAYRQTAAGFRTDGMKTVGRFALAGKFIFEKGWQDSAAWWNGGEYNEAQPYYFFSGKAGPYETQLYQLSATATYRLWKDKWYIGTSGSYRYHWTTRSVDPRPDVKALTTNFRPELTYRHGPHLLGVGFEWGRGSESNTISYKNRNYAGNQLYLDRNNFMSLGFGHIGKLGNNLKRYDDFNGFFAHYAGQLKAWTVQATSGYQLWQEDISLEEPSTRDQHDLYAFLQQDKGYGSLLVSREGVRNRQQWEAGFTTQNLLNWASEFGATSYQYNAIEAHAAYRHQVKKGDERFEFGVGAEWSDRLKEDKVAAHSYQWQTITPRLIGAYYRQPQNGAWLSVHISPSYRRVLANEVTVPATQENYFTTGIVYSDYAYYAHNSWGAEGSLHYLFSSPQRRHRLGFTLTGNWQQAQKKEAVALPAYYLPHGSRWSVAASVNLFL